MKRRFYTNNDASIFLAQLYIMSEKVGYSVLPIPRPGGAWNKKQRSPIDAPLVPKATQNTHQVRLQKNHGYEVLKRNIYCSYLNY